MATITEIKAEQLRRPDTPEGLILQGCGGDLQEWVTGINDMLTEENILLDGSRFEQASVFEHQGLTNLFLPFDDVKLDMGKLAIWRLSSSGACGVLTTWITGWAALWKKTPRHKSRTALSLGRTETSLT